MLASYLSGANDKKVGVQHSATYSPLARLPRMPSQPDTDYAQGISCLRAKPAFDWPFALDSDAKRRYRKCRTLGTLVAGVREWAGSPLGTWTPGELPDDLPHIIDAGLEHGEAYANRAALDGRLRVTLVKSQSQRLRPGRR